MKSEDIGLFSMFGLGGGSKMHYVNCPECGFYQTVRDEDALLKNERELHDENYTLFAKGEDKRQ